MIRRHFGFLSSSLVSPFFLLVSSKQAMAGNMHGAPAKAGTALHSYSWHSILEGAQNFKQPYQRNSAALKWFRMQGEDDPGVPNCAAIEMNMASMSMEIGVIRHTKKGNAVFIRCLGD